MGISGPITALKPSNLSLSSVFHRSGDNEDTINFTTANQNINNNIVNVINSVNNNNINNKNDSNNNNNSSNSITKDKQNIYFNTMDNFNEFNYKIDDLKGITDFINKGDKKQDSNYNINNDNMSENDGEGRNIHSSSSRNIHNKNDINNSSSSNNLTSHTNTNSTDKNTNNNDRILKRRSGKKNERKTSNLGANDRRRSLDELLRVVVEGFNPKVSV